MEAWGTVGSKLRVYLIIYNDLAIRHYYVESNLAKRQAGISDLGKSVVEFRALMPPTFYLSLIFY